jgi:uncharacterized protein YjiS (DUF1127 family)
MSILTVTPIVRRHLGKSFDPRTLVGDVLRRAVSGPQRLIRFWCVRRELAALCAMSGGELRDIGLTPFDVANAFESAASESATDVLAHVAQDRRLRRES